jgi:hypothetical protein
MFFSRSGYVGLLRGSGCPRMSMMPVARREVLIGILPPGLIEGGVRQVDRA